MATSQQLAIRAAAAALVATAIAPVLVFQNRDFKLATDVAAQLHANLAQSDVVSPEEIYTAHPVNWDTVIELTVLARRQADGTEAADAADALWVQAYHAIAANQTLGLATVEQFTPGAMTVEQDEADTSVARLDWRFTVRHRTVNDNLT